MFEDCFISDISTPGHCTAKAELINLCKKKKKNRFRKRNTLCLEPPGQARKAALEKWAVTAEMGWKCCSALRRLGKEERQVHLKTIRAFIATPLGSCRHRIHFPNVKPVALWLDHAEGNDQSQSCGRDKRLTTLPLSCYCSNNPASDFIRILSEICNIASCSSSPKVLVLGT